MIFYLHEKNSGRGLIMLLQGDNEISNSNKPKVKSLYKALKL